MAPETWTFSWSAPLLYSPITSTQFRASSPPHGPLLLPWTPSTASLISLHTWPMRVHYQLHCANPQLWPVTPCYRPLNGIRLQQSSAPLPHSPAVLTSPHIFTVHLECAASIPACKIYLFIKAHCKCYLFLEIFQESPLRINFSFIHWTNICCAPTVCQVLFQALSIQWWGE